MKKTFWIIFSVVLAAGVLDAIAAYAKPPSWAPAHGWRRKHGGDHDDDEGDRRREHREERLDRRVIEERRVEISKYEEIFRRLDSNHDGVVSRSEFDQGDSLFERLDKNHDGILSRSEMEQIDEQRGLISGFIYKVKEKIASFWDKLF